MPTMSILDYPAQDNLIAAVPLGAAAKINPLSNVLHPVITENTKWRTRKPDCTTWNSRALFKHPSTNNIIMKFNSYLLNNNFKNKNTITFAQNQFQSNKETKKSYQPKFGINKITDAEGLKRAYKHGDYHIHGNTMYIAGSHTLRDWYDDFTKIPVFGDLRNSERYQKAHEALMNNPQVKTVVGHSLGGSVALELEKNYNHITNSRTYGAPVFDLMGKESNNVSRYRNWGDIFSIADRSAKKSTKLNPFESLSFTHDYSNIANKFISNEKVPMSQDNDSQILTK